MACSDVAPHSGDWVRSARPAYGWHGGRSRPALRGSDVDATFWDAVGLNGLRDAPRSQHAYGVCDLQQPARPHYAWQPHGCTLHQLDGSAASCATLGRTLLVVGGLPDLGSYLRLADSPAKSYSRVRDRLHRGAALPVARPAAQRHRGPQRRQRRDADRAYSERMCAAAHPCLASCHCVPMPFY